MNIARFIRNNLSFYFRKNLLLALGVAISGAVLTGALMVGDSVSYSLNRIVEQRLGQITHVLKAGDRYFTQDLSDRLGKRLELPVSSLLLQEGSAVADGGQKRLNHVQVIGVDEDFDLMAGVDGIFSSLSGDSILISQNLSNRLSLAPGDEVLLRIQRASLIPPNAPFVSDAESIVTLRASVKGVVEDENLGKFNLKVSQTAPFNIFISRARLEELMDFKDRINVMLIQASQDLSTDNIEAVINEEFSAADAGLELKVIEELQQLEVTSKRVFIDDILATPLIEAAWKEAGQAAGQAEGILTYFVNSLELAGKTTPYSFVSTLPDELLDPDGVIVNQWLADDLGAEVGDTLRMSYFIVGPLRELDESSETFVIRSIVSMEGRFGDGKLMPDLPGLSDAGNCRDWDTGVPISLESIRDTDEDYWDEYGGIPKAFVSVSKGKELWQNRFGTYTAFRYPAGQREQASLESDLVSPEPDLASPEKSLVSLEKSLVSLEKSLMDQIDPAMLGFTLEESRNLGYEAAGSGVDFSQLFGGLSFFLLVAGILLTVLLFLLNLESREGQLQTLVVLGIPIRISRRIMLTESMIVAGVGAFCGLGLAVAYNHLVFIALNGVWKDVVRTDMMQMDVRVPTLITGLLITVAVAFSALYFPLNRKLKKHYPEQKGQRRTERMRNGSSWRRISAWIFIASGLIALVLIGSQLIRLEVVNVAVFFPAGGLLLVSAIFFFLWLLARTEKASESGISLSLLSRKNARRNQTRSMSIIILFAIGAFLVISTGSNRKDLFANSEDPASGTGGFLYYAESTVPVLRRLNDPAVRYEFGLEADVEFVQFRKADGDDASCLNLNKIINPRVLGVDPAELRERFAFVTRTQFLDETDPWSSLQQELPGGLIPAIADETVIKWGLGLKVGDTLHYTNSKGGSMDLLLIGGLAPSIFQGNVLISNERFLEQFPASSGTSVFLVKGETADTAVIGPELARGFRDLGWDMQLSSERLAEFNSVTNAYLSIFMVMGALGLLLGTFGMVVVLSRSIQERKQEIAMLRAVGYSRQKIRKLVVNEYAILLSGGIGTGFITAIIATLPSILSPHTGSSFTSILIWLLILVANGWLWIQLITHSALRGEAIYSALRNE
ncbi:MAG: ABC transporter permease [Bacteroidota bacterium]